MEPRRDDGDDNSTCGRDGVIDVPPQWSPVVTTGTTRTRASLDPRCLAAMEPRRDDGDDEVHAWDDLILDGAAMEPRRDDGDDLSASADSRRDRSRRNGAPS